MKTTLFFFSFFLLAFSATSLLVAADDTLDPVLDVEGKELKANESYYALPPVWALGGGLTLSWNFNGNPCPLLVVQSPSEVDNGHPLVFTSKLGKEDVIRESTPLDIQFLSTPNYCRQSTVWTVNGAFVTIGGDGGSIISNFRIQKSGNLSSLKTYKFVYCFARMACRDIGRFEVNGIRPLTLHKQPWEVVFVKAASEGSKIRKITSG